MTPKVASSDSGTAMLGMIVAHSVRRNRKMTTTTRLIVSSIVNCTSLIAARVVCERSDIRSTWTEGGSDCSSFGINALMRSTTATVLAPGSFWMAMPSARWSPNHERSRSFCTELMTSPTSLMCTGAPFL